MGLRRSHRMTSLSILWGGKTLTPMELTRGIKASTTTRFESSGSQISRLLEFSSRMSSGNSARWLRLSKSKSLSATCSKASSTAFSRRKRIPPPSSQLKVMAPLGPSQDATAMDQLLPISPRVRSRGTTQMPLETPWTSQGTQTRRRK